MNQETEWGNGDAATRRAARTIHEENAIKRAVIGILAHVDAGKTTLIESLLFRTGTVRKLGRVDAGDSHLDFNELEQRRGITIYAKQATVELDGVELTLIDTPGHVDFSSEAERTLQVLDYAVLVIDAGDGVRGHTETLWRLLQRHGIPTFVFANKMDLSPRSRDEVMAELRARLSDACIDFTELGNALAVEGAPMPSAEGAPAPSAGPSSGSLAKGAPATSAETGNGLSPKEVLPLSTEPESGSPAKGSPVKGTPAGGAPATSAETGNGLLPKGFPPLSAELAEACAATDETALDEFFDEGTLCADTLRRLVAECSVFPCLFGSALKHDGVEVLLSAIACLASETPRPPEFGARVFKISHDPAGARLTWMKVTGGSLRVKQAISYPTPKGTATEKIDQIRRYLGNKYETTPLCEAGQICAATGLSRSFVGMSLGCEAAADVAQAAPNAGAPNAGAASTVAASHADASDHVASGKPANGDANAETSGNANVSGQAASGKTIGIGANAKTASDAGISGKATLGKPGNGGTSTEAGSGTNTRVRAATPPRAFKPALVPTFASSVVLNGCDVRAVHAALNQLTDEDPLLAAQWNERLQELQVQVMGAIQLEVLQATLQERFGLDVGFGPAGALYRETITQPVTGIGHFEPLRHYAEVHLLIEPLPAGSGVQFGTRCHVDELNLNWQRLILTNAMEREHVGVLTGSPITDVRITLIGGRAHEKHTEGGDFRQATYRAIRQGLMQAESVLLEPWNRFVLRVPANQVGRAFSDVQLMGARCDAPQIDAGFATVEGIAPAKEIGDYSLQLSSYTHGMGSLSLEFHSYEPCHNAQDVIDAAAYDPEADLVNTPDSVFCSHGAGHTVKWNEVADAAHVKPNPATFTPWREATPEFFGSTRL